MKTLPVLFVTLLLTTIAFSQGEAGYIPKTGFVPDSDTAVRVATLKNDVWTVEGSLRCPDGKGGVTNDCAGGVAVVRISKKDARVLYMLHGK